MKSTVGQLPKISVITPTFNQGAFIEKTINSVLSQNYPNLEFIIIDGGSTDNTVEIIKKYEKQLTYWVSEPDRGQGHAINKGMALGTGEYLTWLNSDDWYLPNALFEINKAFNDYPEASIIVGIGESVNLEGRIIYDFPPGLKIDNLTLLSWFSGTWFLQPASVFKRSVWEKCGPLNEEEHLVFDLELWLKASEAGFTFQPIDKTLAQALVHPDAKTTAMSWRTYVEGAILLERFGASGKIKYEAERLLNEIENMTKSLKWYEENHSKMLSHPLVRLIRPLAKRIARDESQYWSTSIPQWVNKK
jgi:glycosyltransferase involved in cell wall biosynthesis